MSKSDQGIMPVERVAHTSRAVLGLMVAVVLAGGLLFNGGLSLFLAANPGLDNPTYAAFLEQWHRLVGLEEPVETLILGDSSGRHGVDPEILDEALQTDSVNLCTMGNAAVITPAWQLETYLGRHGAPRRVVLVAVSDLWNRDLKVPLIPHVPLPWGFWSDMRAPWHPGRRELRDLFLARYVPVYSQDQTVRDLLMYPWQVGSRRLRFSERGFSPIWKPDPDRAISEFASHKKWLAPAGWRMSASNREALTAMIAMADEYGFELHVANSPLLVGMADDDVFGPYYAAAQTALAEMVASSPRAHLVLSPPAEYPAEQMQNTDHIARMAVEDFTRRLAAAVSAAESSAD